MIVCSAPHSQPHSAFSYSSASCLFFSLDNMSNAYVALDGSAAAAAAPGGPNAGGVPPAQAQAQQQQQYFNPQAYGANYQQQGGMMHPMGGGYGGYPPQGMPYGGMGGGGMMPSLPPCGTCGAVARDRCTYGISRGQQCQQLMCIAHSQGIPGGNGGQTASQRTAAL